MTASLSILFPWRPATTRRQRIFDWVRARYEGIAPDAEVIVADSGHVPFSRAASKNKALAEASGDVVLFADADCVPHEDWVGEMVEECSTRKVWAVPKRCTLLLRGVSDRWLRQEPGTPLAQMPPVKRERDVDWTGISSVGGAVMVSRAGAFMARGYDERFAGWGWEDAAFALALTTVWGAHVKRSDLFHLWHEKDKTWDSPLIKQGRHLMDFYEAAAGRRRTMSELLWEDGHGGPTGLV